MQALILKCKHKVIDNKNRLAVWGHIVAVYRISRYTEFLSNLLTTNILTRHTVIISVKSAITADIELMIGFLASADCLASLTHTRITA